jgi:hypothetical protein
MKYWKMVVFLAVAVNLTRKSAPIRISDDGEGIENKISLGF